LAPEDYPFFRKSITCGSINQAAAKLGMSYRAAWGKVTATEKRLGIKLLNKHTGGYHSGSGVDTRS